MELKDLKLVQNYAIGDSSATIRINRPISDENWEGITASAFVSELDWVVSMGVESVLITINSVGGNLFNAMDIYSAIQDCPAETETRVVGLAASAAGMISLAGNKRTIKEFAIYHAHAPRAKEGTRVGLKVLGMTRDSLQSIMVAGSNMNESEVSEMLDTETYLSASEANEKGLFDEVLPSNTIKMKDSDKIQSMYKSGDLNGLMNVYNSIDLNNASNKDEKIVKNNMEKVTSVLGLGSDAQESEVVAAITSLKDKVEKPDNSALEASQSEVSRLTAELETERSEKAVSLVESNISAGKIKEDSKESWLKSAKSDFATTKDMLDKMPSVEASQEIFRHVENSQSGSPSEDRSKWNFGNWSSLDSEGLKKMQNESPEDFDKLLKDYSGTPNDLG